MSSQSYNLGFMRRTFSVKKGIWKEPSLEATAIADSGVPCLKDKWKS